MLGSTLAESFQRRRASSVAPPSRRAVPTFHWLDCPAIADRFSVDGNGVDRLRKANLCRPDVVIARQVDAEEATKLRKSATVLSDGIRVSFKASAME
jgi:hypothetical protein